MQTRKVWIWLTAVLLLCLMLVSTGCTVNHSSAYNKAVEIFASGEYADAAEAFEKLGDYQNSAILRQQKLLQR